MSDNLRSPRPEHFKAAAWKAIEPVVTGEVPLSRIVFEYPGEDGAVEKLRITVEKVLEGEDPDATEHGSEHAIRDLRSAKTSRTDMSWDGGPQPAKGA